MQTALFRTARSVYSGPQRAVLNVARSISSIVSNMGVKTRIVAVGDVHGSWGDVDVAALKALAPGVPPEMLFACCD